MQGRVLKGKGCAVGAVVAALLVAQFADAAPVDDRNQNVPRPESVPHPLPELEPEPDEVQPAPRPSQRDDDAYAENEDAYEGGEDAADAPQNSEEGSEEGCFAGNHLCLTLRVDQLHPEIRKNLVLWYGLFAMVPFGPVIVPMILSKGVTPDTDILIRYAVLYVASVGVSMLPLVGGLLSAAVGYYVIPVTMLRAWSRKLYERDRATPRQRKGRARAPEGRKESPRAAPPDDPDARSEANEPLRTVNPAAGCVGGGVACALPAAVHLAVLFPAAYVVGFFNAWFGTSLAICSAGYALALCPGLYLAGPGIFISVALAALSVLLGGGGSLVGGAAAAVASSILGRRRAPTARVAVAGAVAWAVAFLPVLAADVALMAAGSVAAVFFNVALLKYWSNESESRPTNSWVMATMMISGLASAHAFTLGVALLLVGNVAGVAAGSVASGLTIMMEGRNRAPAEKMFNVDGWTVPDAPLAEFDEQAPEETQEEFDDDGEAE